MGLEKAGLKLINVWAKTSERSLLATKPLKINIEGLRYAPQLEGDVIQISRNVIKKPSAEKLSILIKEQGLEAKYINDNNSLFLEELIQRFPLEEGQTNNKTIQDIMTCLEDINHSSFIDKKQFLNEFIKEFNNVEEMFGDVFNFGTKLFSKRAVLQAKYNNPERYTDIMNLYNLYKSGKAPKYMLATLFPESTFHHLPKSDMQKLLKGENYYPQFQNLSSASNTKLDIGEAFSVGREMFVKTATGFEKLKIDATTYEKLFPPIERYAIAQGPLGNCHLMATLDSIIKNPEGRIDLYKMFEQVENGVKCSIAGYPTEGVIYSFDNLSHLYTPTNLSGPLGHKMVEYTYAKNYYQECLKGPFEWRVKEMTNGNLLKIFDVPGEYDDITDHLTKLLGYSSETIWPKQFSSNMSKVKGTSKNISIVNCLSENPKKGLIQGHFYNAGNLNKNCIINPWNTIEEIHCSPFNLADITYVI